MCHGLDNPLHIALFVVVVFLVFGARNIPGHGQGLGTGMREFKERRARPGAWRGRYGRRSDSGAGAHREISLKLRLQATMRRPVDGP